MRLSLLKELPATLEDRLANQDDAPEARARKVALVLFAALMGVGGIVWGVICLYVGLYLPSIIPLGYSFCISICVLLLFLTKRFKILSKIILFLSLILPFLLQWTLGGFAVSGAVMYWAIIGVLAALVYSSHRAAFVFILFFALFTVGSGWIDGYLQENARYHIPTNVSSILFSVNMLLVSIIVIMVIRFFIQLLTRNRSELQKALEAANSANKMKNEFMGTMSHEIRTPLNAIIGFGDLLLAGNLTEDERRRHVLQINQAGENLLELINEILDISRIESGALAIEEKPLNLGHLIQHVIDLMDVEAKTKGLELSCDIQWETLMVQGDESRLRQILLNLVGNAVKFTGQGRVSIKAQKLQSPPDDNRTHVQISVRDTGIGIIREEHENIFQKFTQANSGTTREYGGSGLGLAICRMLINLMGGSIIVNSKPEEGSTFTLLIPFKPGPKTEASTKPNASLITKSPESPALKGKLHGKRILLAEDNIENQELFRVYLQDQGLELEFAENGQIAVEKALSRPYDLILMDMQMPILGGLDATREIISKTSNAQSQKPPLIIGLSANAYNEDIQASLTAGCSAYLTKPIKKDALIKELKYWLN